MTDHGPGIPREELPRIFQRYRRAVTYQAEGGLGLGLYVTRKLVEAQGGRIWVASQAGRGSTFSSSRPIGRDRD